MKEKIELYREMLQQDPRSRAFFLLAEAFQEAGLSKEAVAVLREGLQWHPDFLEARMLLIQILFVSGDERAISEAAPVSFILERYPGFWEALSRWAAGEKAELVLPLRLLSAALRHPGMGIEALFELGLACLDGKTGQKKLMGHPESRTSVAMERPYASVLSAADEEKGELPEISLSENSSPEHGEPVDSSEYPSFRTRSMANVLAEQGDFVGALEIYRELESQTSDEEEKQALQSCVRLLEKRMGSCTAEDSGGPPVEKTDTDSPDSVELNDLLESLADRLEARARSGASVMSGEL